MSKTYTIYSQRLAGYLMQQGFPLLYLSKNHRTRLNRFIFHNSKILQDYIDKWQVIRVENEARDIVKAQRQRKSKQNYNLIRSDKYSKQNIE